MSAATTQLPHAAPVPDALQLLGEGSGRDDDHFDNEGRADGGTAADTTVEPSDRFEKPLSNSTEPDLEAQEDQARGAGKSIFRTSAEKERELASRSPAYQDDEIDDYAAIIEDGAPELLAARLSSDGGKGTDASADDRRHTGGRGRGVGAERLGCGG